MALQRRIQTEQDAMAAFGHADNMNVNDLSDGPEVDLYGDEDDYGDEEDGGAGDENGGNLANYKGIYYGDDTEKF